MFRKLFHGRNNAQAMRMTTEPRKGEERGDFALCAVQLDAFEGRLNGLVDMLLRHSQALTEMCASSINLTEKLSRMHSDTKDESGTDFGNAMRLVNEFRTTTLGPLQAMLAVIPQLRLRCDHRERAQISTARYEQKVNDLEKAGKSDKARLQRNRAKLQAALTRYRELDASARREITAFVSHEFNDALGDSIETILLQAQRTAAERLLENASYLQTNLPTMKARKSDSDMLVPQEEEPAMSCGTTEASASSGGDNNAPTSLPPPIAIVAPSLPPPSSTETPPPLNPTMTESKTINWREDVGIGKRRKHTYGTRTWDIHQHIKNTMSSGVDIIDCVRLPDGYKREEWIAVHVIDFFNEINLLYGTISECCTAESCPQMAAGACYTYMWADGVQQVTPISLPAPDNFVPNTAAVIFKRLFRVYAHMYHSHLVHFGELGADTHLALCFKRFLFFVREFRLVEQKELNALRKLIQAILEDPTAEHHDIEELQ
ncbi:hypothetical protein Poli38472_003110 [Pythium oligandrum]|uniref:Uncharacterized protein n=1 Tax=Pythium oligandrum TaxID=41045 RepID=A0A8K1C6E4_PYTOL|nr:hypothetical protein Poli38472_003110 [Pythium oligandrum]|eukprot:TMW57185.1 hypothetical protein Poli38472_003110 [Pythium oligandrum]